MKRFFICLLLVVSISCESELEAPVQLVSKDKMISAIIYMRIAESRVLERNVYGDSALIAVQSYEHAMYDQLQIDSATYVSSYNYYISRNEDWNYILGAVVDSLTNQEKILKSNM